MDAYQIVLAVHNIVRWIVIIIGLMAASRALYGWLAGRAWTDTDNRLGLFFTISVDTQVLIGLILYFLLSPITTTALGDFGAAMADSDTRFWTVEHIFAMLAVLILVHVGRALSRRAIDERVKYRWAAIFYTLAVIVLVLGTPWFRPLFPGL